MKHKNTILAIVGAAWLLLGIMLLIIKALSPEYVDANGTLHEYFFLLPCGFGCLFCGIALEVPVGIRALVWKLRNKKNTI